MGSPLCANYGCIYSLCSVEGRIYGKLGHRIGLVPAQDGLFALILWYVAKTLFRS